MERFIQRNNFPVNGRRNYDNLMIIALVITLLAVIFAYGMGNVSAASGDTIYVNGSSGNDDWDGQSATYTSGINGPKLSIKSAIGTVNENGNISIADGKYIGDGNTKITINKNMNINGQSQQGTIINGTGTNWIFNIQPGIYVTLTNLTLTNGTAPYGGAISNSGTLTVNSSTFTSNTANSYGGAIYNEYDCTLTVNNTTFTANTANENGGAIRNNYGNLNIIVSKFTYNTANMGHGGAICNTGNMNVIDSNFRENTANTVGGAISNFGDTLNVINSSTFTSNTAAYGGAIYNFGTMTLKGSNINNNTATSGGAIYNTGGIITANYNRIVGNSPNAILREDGTVNVEYNWWGSNLPDFASIISGTVTYDPWVILSVGVTPNIINGTSTSTITADLNHDSNHAALINGHIPDGVLVNFGYPLGDTNPVTKLLASGSASSILSAFNSYSGTMNATATVDGFTVGTPLTVDQTVPTPLSFDPVNNALNIPINKVIRVVFSEHIQAGSTFSNIILKDNYGTNIPILKSFSPNAYNPGFFDLVITRSSGTFPNGYRYTLSMPINSIMDLAGNGITNAYTDTFTIVTLPPTVVANPIGGYYNTTKTVNLTMNEPGTIYYTINGTSPTTKSTPYTSALTISSTKTLKYIAQDLAGNLSTIYTQTYTIDKTAPKIATTTPTNLKTGVSKTASITIKFSENIKNSTAYNNITIKNLTTGKTVSITKSISGTTLNIKTTATRSANTWYQVTIPKAAVKDYAGNNLSATYTFKFKTGS